MDGVRGISERITDSMFLLSLWYKPFCGVPFLSFLAEVSRQTPWFPERRPRATARRKWIKQIGVSFCRQYVSLTSNNSVVRVLFIRISGNKSTCLVVISFSQIVKFTDDGINSLYLKGWKPIIHFSSRNFISMCFCSYRNTKYWSPWWEGWKFSKPLLSRNK